MHSLHHITGVVGRNFLLQILYYITDSTIAQGAQLSETDAINITIPGINLLPQKFIISIVSPNIQNLIVSMTDSH